MRIFDGYSNYLRLIVTFLLVVSAKPIMALDEQSVIKQIQALDWQTEPGVYKLPDSNSSVKTSEVEYLLKGAEAHRYMRIAEGHDAFKPDALVVRIDGPNQDTQILFTYNEIGYVEMDDWDEHIDKDSLLKEIQNNTEAANAIKEEGYAKLYVDGWAQEPFLDKVNAVVYWAVSAHTSDGFEVINAKAMKLGRKGYSEIIWMGSPEQFTNAKESLSPSLIAYQFSEGAKYADFVPGTDTVAAVGAGALAYKLITGKATAKVGAGFLALLAIFAKKFWFIIFIPFIFVWKWIKKKITSKKEL